MMTNKRVLITGGAGFIGSHVADELLEHGYAVRILDCLDPQIHGDSGQPPSYLNPAAEFVLGDVRNEEHVSRALEGVAGVIHLAAAVGVGQSMYEIAHYTSVNDLGTAVLLQSMVSSKVEKLVVASSMSIYGEGSYRDQHGQVVLAKQRDRAQLAAGEWELRDPTGHLLEPLPTSEEKAQDATSVYALSKYVQERLCLIWGAAYQTPSTALRFFNVYGPRQALSNPYTGVLAIFAARYLSGQSPMIFEDGNQRRDFVNVHDVARACRLALESPRSGGEVFNVGSGVPISINEICDELATVLNCHHIEPEVVNRYRVGDIRHCCADISKAERLLGYVPRVSFSDGLTELAGWLNEQQDSVDESVGQLANAKLLQHGLVV